MELYETLINGLELKLKIHWKTNIYIYTIYFANSMTGSNK